MAVQTNALTSSLSDLYSTAGGAVTDLTTIAGGADVLASQMDELKSAVQDLADFANTMRSEGYYTPVGAIMPFAGIDASVPSGWYICDGVVVHGSSALQTILSAAGFADPTKTPNLKGKVIIGVDASSYALASAGGQAGGLQSLVTGNLPSHTHTGSTDNGGVDHTHGGSTSGAGAHSHTVGIGREIIGRASGGSTFGKYDDGGPIGTSGVGDHAHSFTTGGASAYAHSHTFTTNATGSGTAFSVMQPYLTLNYIIKG